MAVYGEIEPFDVKDGDFEEYKERLDQYFVANDVVDEKKCAVFISVVGKDAYGVIRSLVAPAKPSEKTYTQITTAFANHIKPKPIVIAERFKFYERSQKDDEGVAEFVAAIRKLAINCDFNAFLGEALRDRLVCGLKSSKIRKRLMVERDLDLTKATEIAK